MEVVEVVGDAPGERGEALQVARLGQLALEGHLAGGGGPFVGDVPDEGDHRVDGPVVARDRDEDLVDRGRRAGAAPAIEGGVAERDDGLGRHGLAVERTQEVAPHAGGDRVGQRVEAADDRCVLGDADEAQERRVDGDRRAVGAEHLDPDRRIAEDRLGEPVERAGAGHDLAFGDEVGDDGDPNVGRPTLERDGDHLPVDPVVGAGRDDEADVDRERRPGVDAAIPRRHQAVQVLLVDAVSPGTPGEGLHWDARHADGAVIGP